MEPDRCDDLKWFSLSSLPKNIMDYVGVAIKNYQKGIIYSEYGWDK
jgi:hypothetical protein